MYDDLFAELDKELSKATHGIKKLNSKLNITKRQMKIVSKEEFLPKTYKHIEKQMPAYQFPKTQRFIAKKEHPLDEFQASYASFSTNPSLDSIKNKGPSIVFAKSQRFMEQSQNLDEDATEINPNFDVNKRKTPTLAVYKLPVKNELTINKSSNINESENIIEDVGPGPGEYEINFDLIEKRKNGGIFYKSERFKQEEEDETQDITPNYDVIKPKVKTTIIKPETEKNEKLLQMRRFDQFLQIIQAKYRQIRPIDNDKLLQSHIPSAFIGPKPDLNAKNNKKSEMLKFFHLMDKMNELRGGGPGTYNLEKKLEGPCMVVYRSCSPVFRNPLKDKRPAPNQYSVNDNLVKESQPKFTFNKSAKNKELKIEDLDWRKPLNLDQNAVKKRIPLAIMLPEQKTRSRRPRALSDINANRLGPGRYNLIFDLVENRKDKGVLPFKLTTNNDREVQMDLAQKDIFDGELDPNYDYDKPRKPNFIYHEPIEWNPPHPSDGMLFKERWRFYDYNVNKVRPEIKPIDFAKNLNMKEFLQFEYDFQLLENYLQRRRKIPELGKYNVEYKQIDKNVPVPDLEKMIERVEKEPELTDELILNPDKPKPKIPTIDFEKHVGRETVEIDNSEKLLLEPTYTQLDKKVPGFVEFDKFLDRHEPSQENNNEELLLQPKFDYIDPKIKGNADFGKLVAREDDPLNNIPTRLEECIINPKEDAVRPHTANLVRMDKGGERFIGKAKIDDNKNNENKNPQIDVVQAYEAIKPERNTLKFDGYSGREKPKIKISKKPNTLFIERKNNKK